MASSPLRLRLALAAVASFFLGASTLHCGSSASGSGAGGAGGNAPSSTGASNAGGAHQTGSGGSASTGGGSGLGGNATSGGTGGAGVGGGSGGSSDPAPTSCDAGGMPPPPPGGSAKCPDDKNLPGCPCVQNDQTATCWTGLRENRGHGDCQDGTTTCTKVDGELVWGACDGEVLPVGDTGKSACLCFSTGHWAIDNLEPCFLTTTDGMGNTTTVAYASTNGNPVTCPIDGTGMPIVPADWSTDTLMVDCSGYYKLCYTLKAGDPMNPMPSDCSFASSCTAQHYAPANMVETFPPLPGWESTTADAACVQQFLNGGGYGEMSVQGQSDECETVDRVFQRITYCPLSCSQPNPPPSCATCMSGGGGGFLRLAHPR